MRIQGRLDFCEGRLAFLSGVSAQMIYFKALLFDIFTLFLFIDPTLCDTAHFFDFGTVHKE